MLDLSEDLTMARSIVLDRQTIMGAYGYAEGFNMGLPRE
jgi:hypothetical protein